VKRTASWAALLVLVGACSEPPGVMAPAAVAPVLEDVVARRRAEFGPGLESPADPGAPDAAAQELLAAVLGALESADADFRALAAEDARGLPEAGIAALALVLGDAQRAPELRAAVAELLGRVASPVALDALVTSIEMAGEPWLRAHCAYALGLARQDSVLPRLVLRLKYEQDFATAFWIADAVARFEHLAGVDGMLAVWSGTGDATLKAQAEARLIELAAARGCQDAGELIERWHAATLAPPAIPFAPGPAALGEAWRWIGRLGQWNLRDVDDARFVLVRLEEWVVPLLAEALRDQDVYVRLHAAQVLERRGPRARGARLALETALDEPRIGATAANALGALGLAESAERLERAVASPDAELAVAATRALGRIGAARSLPLLRATCTGARALDLRQAAAAAWLVLEDAPEARAFLAGCLTDPAADAGEAELALAAWLERTPAAAAVLARWSALEPEPGSIPTPAQVDARRRARQELLRKK
jgi:HEAT repeat protein